MTDASDIAARLIARLDAAHAAFAGRPDVEATVLRGLAAVREAVVAAVTGIDEGSILRAPAPDEWCMAEIVEHIADHDASADEVESLGLDHYVEHGLEHALQLWRLRQSVRAPGAPDGRASATLE